MGFFGDFQFEPRNFGLGLLAGWATAFVAYQTRNIVQSMRESAGTQATTARGYVTRTAEGRYSRELIQFCETNHLLGERVPLSKVLIEPRFLAPPAFAAPPDDDVNFDVFRVVPRIHDHPWLHQPYNVEWASMDDLGYGDRAIALLGLPGSGRTTALQAIALWNMGVADFTPPKDTVTEKIEAEERALKADQRAERIKDRMSLEERARERLAEEQGIDPGLKGQEKREAVSPMRRLTPVYVHLANVFPTVDRFGRQADPAEPLLRGIQAHLRYVTSKTFPRRFYERLNQGRLLILIDGYDDLPEADRRKMLPWLSALIREHRKNFFVVTGPAYGYGNLLRTGMSPVFLRPWDDNDIQRAVKFWAENWGQISGRRREQPDQATQDMAFENTRGLTPLDVCLKIRATFAGDSTAEMTPGDWMRLYLDDLGLNGEQLLAAAQAAALQLDENFITAARLAELAQGLSLPITPVDVPLDDEDVFAPTSSDEDIDALFEADIDEDVDALFEGDQAEASGAETPAKADKAANKTERKEATQTAKNQSELIAALERLGLLVWYSGDRYRFRHLPTAAYLASLTFKTADPSQVNTLLVNRAAQPAWDLALAYAAGHTPIDAAVRARLNSHPDVLYNHVFNTARWLAYAGNKADWRPALMKQLGNLFILPAQYTLLRERAAAALCGTRDKTALVVFQRALKSADADARRLACLGTGVFQEVRAIDQIGAYMNDKNPEVTLAAALALGAVGTDRAYEEMAVAFTSGSEPLRQVIAEAFGNLPEPGYETLYEAVTAEDMLLRRASIFGLRRVKTPWALIAIYKAFLEDDQWYVRSAAQQAFLDMQNNVISQSLRGYPEPEAIPWLRDQLSGGEVNPEQALIDTLTQAGPDLQSISALAMGQLGMANNIIDLYQALLYREPVVRDAAHRALAELQARIGQQLPAPA